MLQKLSINNYAIIQSLDISFSPKLNMITGETGAGKSIIMGALGLILGERADSTVLVNKEKKSVVEGVFLVQNNAIKKFMEENEFDQAEELLIRREIAVNGKSRAFINDTPVNLSQLNQLTSLLVDLHQQFDTLELGDSDFQREVIDALAGHSERVEEYRKLYGTWQQTRIEFEALKQKKLLFDKEFDYNNFQFKELEEAGFAENELEDIEAELKMLANAEGIKSALSKAYYEFEESETPLLNQVKITLNLLNSIASYHPSLPAIIERLEAAQIQLKDIAAEIDQVNHHIHHDPMKTEQLNERLSLGYKLQKKHGVKSTDELLSIQSELEKKLAEVLEIDVQIGDLEQKTRKAMEATKKMALELSEARKAQLKPLEVRVNKLLAQVGMPNARLKVEIKEKEPGPFGMDSIEFLFDANKSGQYQPVSKVASGGELSRLMLCIKSLVARSIDLPTMIFDEIDTGISGEAARQVGIILKELASQRQVICITHQPQIAGRADAHFFVYKEIEAGSVKTNIRLLNTEERITALAKMLSGEKPTAAAMENAREMLQN